MSPDDNQEELALFRENIRRFAAEYIAPHYQQWEKDGLVTRQLWNQLGEAGLLCVEMPEQYGGCDVDTRFAHAIYEEFSYLGYTGIYAGTCVHSGIVAHYIHNSGTEDQREKYLADMAAGRKVGAVAMTEPDAGSDLQSLRTSAVREGSHYRINGSKIFISNGQHCDFVIVAAKTDREAPGSRGISLFIVDADTPGFKKGTNLEKLGQHCADTSEMFFDDVVVPESALLGKFNDGFGVMMKELPRERLLVAAAAVAAAAGALDTTISYVKERKVFGQALGKFQNTRFRIAEMQTEVRVHQGFVAECLALLESGSLDNETASMAKLSATEMQGRVVDGCLQLHGGYGYMTEYPISRAYVDARAQRIYAGTSEIMKEIIGRSLLGR